MDARERYNDPEEILRVAFAGMMKGVWTALPGIITAFNADNMTATVQPAIQGVLRSADAQGTLTPVNMPLLLDCPVQFQSGGGITQTFPIEPGDECLVVFASRCIDAWWQSGGVQPPAEMRFHDLSDGFCLPGVRSVPRALVNFSRDAAQLRTEDGTCFVELSKTGQVKISAINVYVHASKSYTQDVNGYGTKTTHTGGNSWRIDEYVDGADITTVTHPINPPEVP